MADIHQVQVWIDRDYEDGMKALRHLLATVVPEIEPFDTLQGMVSQIDNYIAGFIRGDKWTIDKWREEYQVLTNRNDDHVAELNRRGTALQRIALLGDTMSEVHHKAFDTGPGQPIANGWRVAEAMREVANDVIGSEPICDSCGGEGQVQLTDEGGNRMWWACPACRHGASEMTLSDSLRRAMSRCGRSRYRLARQSQGELSEQLLSAFALGKCDLSLRKADRLMRLVGLEVSTKAKSRV